MKLAPSIPISSHLPTLRSNVLYSMLTKFHDVSRKIPLADYYPYFKATIEPSQIYYLLKNPLMFLDSSG